MDDEVQGGKAGPEEADLDALRLGFVTMVYTDEDQSYRGAILVMDGRGKPLEFRCTDPIRPNAAQRTLYGRTLLPYIAQELIACPLAGGVSERAQVLLTDNPDILGARPKVGVPSVHVRRQGQAMRPGGSEVGEGEQETEHLLTSEAATFAPIIVRSHWTVPEEAQWVRALLQPVFLMVDLLEPFERVRNALEQIRQSEGKKK